jgi:hypothetical protein
LGNLDTGLQLKEKIVSYRHRFLKKSSKGFQTIKIKKKEVIREKMWVTQTVLE